MDGKKNLKKKSQILMYVRWCAFDFASIPIHSSNNNDTEQKKNE